MNLLKSLCFFAGILVLSRLIPHPPNFTPLIAGVVFLPFLLNDKRVVVGLPLSVLFISDLIIGFHGIMLWTYAAFTLIGLVVYRFSKFNISNLLVLAVSSPTLFYVITNFGVWINSSIYLKNISGLMECYYLAIPFYSNSLVSTVLFVLLFYTTRVVVLKVQKSVST